MTWRAPTRWPIRWQIVALIAVTQLLAHALTIFAIDLATQRNGGGRGDLAISIAEPFLTVLRLLPHDTGSDSAASLEGLIQNDSRFRLEYQTPTSANASATALDDSLRGSILSEVPAQWRDNVLVYTIGSGGLFTALPGQPLGLSAHLPDGRWLVFESRSDSLVQNVPRAVALLGFLLLGIPLTFLALWAGAVLVAPITALAREVERFSEVGEAPPLPERGPVEVRQATRAFNRMRLRIRKLINDRSQTLAAIGHDMRTPLTRMRLQLELLEPNATTEAIDTDISVLERMINDALTFLRSEGKPIRLETLDVAILAQTMANEYADRGHAITYEGPERLILRCDHDLLTRALDNVVGNAAKFATEARIRLTSSSPGKVRIDVVDNGEGIPAHQRELALEPFTRIEAVRLGITQKTKGFGLGLAIARDAIERHGGRLSLSDNTPKGLIVSMTLPSSATVSELQDGTHD